MLGNADTTPGKDEGAAEPVPGASHRGESARSSPGAGETSPAPRGEEPQGTAAPSDDARAEADTPAGGTDRSWAAPQGSDLGSRLARLAVKSGMADPAGVRECLEALTEPGEEGDIRPLGAILVEHGVLAKTQVSVLLEALQHGDELETVGGFQIIDKLGEGAMGTVYKARQVTLERAVALKILPERLAGDPQYVERLLREARSAAKLDHPNIVRAIDAGKARDRYYFAMELVEGRTLEAALRERGCLPEEEALGIAIQATRGLDCAWRNGLVHRDIKPDNILITPEGVAKIADLGLVRQAEGVEAAGLTQDGTVLGTPHYISPEQAKGEDIDIRTDIYSLGVTLYRMVTGKHPFTGTDPVSIIVARFNQRPVPANYVNPEVSDELSRVIETMMAADRESRYPDPAVLLHDLDLLSKGEEPEFASESAAARTRAIAAARTQRVSSAVITVVSRKRRRSPWTIAVAAAIGAVAILIPVLLLRGFLGGAPEKTGAGLVPPAAERHGRVSLPGPPEGRALEAPETEAGAFHDACLEAFEAGRYGEVVEKLDSSAAGYAGTSHGPELGRLRARALAELEAAERRAKEEAEKERRYRELVTLAREELGAGDYATALGLLAQARGVKETEEVERLILGARQRQYRTRAQDAERDGKLARAVDLYTRALRMEDDAGLRARVAELERRLLFETKLAGADGLAERGSWKAARAAYREALKIASEDEAGEIRSRLAAAEREIRYSDLVEKSLALSRAAEWREALDAARAAAAVKPDAREPKELVLQARRALGPEREIANSIGMSFVLMPAGEFIMGSHDGDPDERPRHKVHLDAYYVGKCEVTNAQFEEFDGGHRRTEYSPGDDMPVVAVSWRDAVAFCRWLSEKEGIEYRLPTEAEWEKAARGTDGRTYPWGDEEPGAGGTWRCNIAVGEDEEGWAEDGHRYASPVDSCPEGRSPFGAYGMAGNVWEWCLDWYRADYYAAGEAKNPRGPASGRQRVLRGGSFGNAARHVRCANRSALAPDLVEACVGFRCVRLLDPIFRRSEGENE